MSSKKRPLRELSQAPNTPRYAPSTPHALRALQQRSGAGRRSTRINKIRADTQPPDSARGILRRLAKITAPLTKRRPTTPTAKENLQTGWTKKAAELAEGDDEVDERPTFTLPIVEENGWDDEVDSDLGEAPTPSVLPGDEYDPTITFQCIPSASEVGRSMSESPGRRVPRISQHSNDGEDDEDDREVEVGRRAVSEGPVDRYPRISFGSIRMSDFGLDNQARVSYNPEEDKTGFDLRHDYDIGVGFGDDDEPDLDNETEDFRRHRRSPSVLNELNADEQDGVDGSTFKLEILLDAEAHDLQSRIAPSTKDTSNSDQDPREADLDHDEESVSPDSDSAQEEIRQLTPMEAAATQRPRRKRVKLTRSGVEIPVLPSSLVRRVAIESITRLGKRKAVIDRASLRALEQATEWFFEQVGEDLEAYSNHAGRRKRIEASDVLALMRRQRVLMGDGKLGDFALEHLPSEALLELDLPDTL